MPCDMCGGGDEWIKTCHTPEGSRLLVCDECYEENATVLVHDQTTFRGTERCS
jgi:ribosome-binding protein aMBF1 (putative translation factor)